MYIVGAETKQCCIIKYCITKIIGVFSGIFSSKAVQFLLPTEF